MNNSVFGKTMENLRKRVDIKVVRTCGNPKEKEQIRKIIAKPNYDRAVIFSEELSALHSHKTRLKLNKPVYVGMCVLDDITKFTLKYILSSFAILIRLFWPYEQIFCCSLNMLYACNYVIN